ncbi:DNA polymerase III subunit [bacterium]|nr:DNA polymerase III subunit [bacterium]
MTKTVWFEAVTGHARAKEVLVRALESGRVPPALVLAGREGTGRSLVARELAKALNCKGEAAARLAEGKPAGAGKVPCGACAPCKKTDSGAHSDFVRVTPEEGKAALGIDAVRATLDEIALAPVEGRRRVFVFDPADAMTEDAQNALLKALEEPPARAHVILIATHEDALLRTIASRSFVLALSELTPDEVGEVLVKQGVSRKDAASRAAWAGGSPGIALRPRHEERVSAARFLLEALAGGGARRDPIGTAAELMSRAAPKNAAPQERRDGALEVTEIVARALRDALDQAVRGEKGARVSGADRALLEKLASGGRDAVARAIEACVKADEAILAQQNVNLALEGLVLDATRS